MSKVWKSVKTMMNFLGYKVPVQVTHSDKADFEAVMKSELFGRRIVRVQGVEGEAESYLYLDDGRRLRLVGNEGCGGCSNGWYYLKSINTFDNAITNVELVVDGDSYCGDVYKLFVLSADDRLDVVSYEGCDNGYYGTGFSVFVQVEQDAEKGD